MTKLWQLFLIGWVLTTTVPVLNAGGPAKTMPNPFYAMDTAFQRGKLSTDQQFALVKELGFAGIAWTEAAPDQVRSTAELADKHGLKKFAIYCRAEVNAAGNLSHRPELPRLMQVLKGRGTIVWLHIGGRGPAFDALSDKTPLVKKLRELADLATENGLRIAVYPHVGEWTAHFGDATRLAAVVQHKSFGVTFNLCHALAMGDEEKIPTLLVKARPYLMTATINGADSGIKGGQWNRLIQPLGKGTYDTRIVLRQLKQIGFAGPIGFQGYGIRGDARSILRPTIEAWRKLSKEVRAGKIDGDARIRGKAGPSEIVITTTHRLAGAIDSLTWNGKEFIDSHDHGRQLQSAANFDLGKKFIPEVFNPTEAGSMADGTGTHSSSKLLDMQVGENDLRTQTQMAFWLRPGEKSRGHPAYNDRILSNHILSKHIQIGFNQFPHAIVYDVTFTIPGGEHHTFAQFEAVTGYMPAEFRNFWKLDPDTGKIAPLDDGPGEQPWPIIFATADGQFAMGVYSPDQPSPGYANAGYGRFRFRAEKVVKWNSVFRLHSARGLAAGTYRFRNFLALGTLEDARETLVNLARKFPK